jgi:6-phosphogluconate dehydrogenase (decarboxylating)
MQIGMIEDSGEGRWIIQAALEEGVSAEVLSVALYTLSLATSSLSRIG